MSELAEFLLARIAEDEAEARAAFDDRDGALIGPEWWEKPEHGRVYSGHWVPVVETSTYYEPGPTPEDVVTHHGLGRDSLAHIARWDPARVLAECEAKRRIVEVHALVPATDIWGEQTGGLGCAVCDERADLTCGGYEIESSGGCATLRLLALPYADHPDYRQEWKP